MNCVRLSYLCSFSIKLYLSKLNQTLSIIRHVKSNGDMKQAWRKWEKRIKILLKEPEGTK